jgi:spore coat polysaccharide biosynthesis protein SpsF (cytidylyltransferase family)
MPNLHIKQFSGNIVILAIREGNWKLIKNPILYQQTSKNIQSQYLKDSIAMYIDYLKDLDTPHHLKKHLSKSYIKRTITSLKHYARFLVNRGANLNT